MTLTISKYKLSKQHTITLDYTLGETENLFTITDLYAYDLQEFFGASECGL